MTEAEKIEAEVADVVPSEKFTSPAGDVSLKFLDQEFTRIEKWIDAKLGESRYKSLILTQLELSYSVIRAFVAKALG